MATESRPAWVCEQDLLPVQTHVRRMGAEDAVQFKISAVNLASFSLIDQDADRRWSGASALWLL
eukprot:3353127-Amphidinium_carterae.1